MSALNTPDDDLGFDLDLDAMRSARREVAEVEKRVPGIRLGGRRLELPVELPIDVLEPLTKINVDISVLIRQILDARQAAGDQSNEAVLDAVVDMLVVNPSLPHEVIGAIKEMAARLFGEGYDHLTGQRLFVKDLGEIAKYVLKTYGVSLGEASRPSDSSEGTGTTSTPTSPGDTTETSATSGDVPATPAS